MAALCLCPGLPLCLLSALPPRCSPPRLSAAPPAVILTRERGKNGKLDALLRERGVPTAELPCIAFQQLPAGQAELPPALAEETPAWVVVTSPEAAGVLAEGWERAGRPHLRLASVGGATAKALQSLGLRSAFTPTKATGRALAEELPLDHGDSGGGDGAPPAVLYPCSALAADTVCAGLERRGFGVRRIDTYTTVAAEWGPSEEEAARAASVVSFGSPSAVRVWHERVCPWWRERPASRARAWQRRHPTTRRRCRSAPAPSPPASARRLRRRRASSASARRVCGRAGREGREGRERGARGGERPAPDAGDRARLARRRGVGRDHSLSRPVGAIRVAAARRRAGAGSGRHISSSWTA